MGRSFDGSVFRRLKAALRRQQRQPCALCSQPIDYRLQYPHVDSFSADHIAPVEHRPDLALVFSNLQPAHLACNRSRGSRMPAPGLGNITGQW